VPKDKFPCSSGLLCINDEGFITKFLEKTTMDFEVGSGLCMLIETFSYKEKTTKKALFSKQERETRFLKY